MLSQLRQALRGLLVRGLNVKNLTELLRFGVWAPAAIMRCLKVNGSTLTPNDKVSQLYEAAAH